MTKRFHGLWWRPADARVEDHVQVLLDLKVTDVCVWAEPFIDRQPEWEALVRQVKAAKIQFHTWITVNHHYAAPLVERLRSHEPWLAVDYHGQNSSQHPLAGIQTWACPTNEDRWRAEWEVWRPLLKDADGLHLDYIRYPDGFRFGETPEISRVEVADQSFCYCAQCCQRYREAYGIDPRSIPIIAGHPEFDRWQKWRQDRIVSQVHWYRQRLSDEFGPNLALSAAVFPTPSIARNNVQQDWPRFADVLDFVCPMIYAKQFWGQPTAWIQQAVGEGRRETGSTTDIMAGIGPHDTYQPEEIADAIVSARAGGSDGEMVFVYPMAPAYLSVLKELWA